ncbi:MAG: tyrosine-type recombinase/integrase [Chloroflexi bacterium]|nr:tyrosine-type recombinase/integrase [Chloroflexota bacterium]
MTEPKRDQLLFVLRKTELAQGITAFVVDRQARGLSRRTCQYYASELRHWQAYLEARGVHKLQDITADHVRQYLLHLQERGRNPGGVHCAYRVAKTFLRWCWQEYDLAPPCPIAKVNAPRLPHELLEPVSMSDLKAMLATCGKDFTGARDKAILLCLLDTGCRASEFLALDVQDVNLATGAVIIRHGKGGKFRTCFLGSKARRELLRYLRHRSDLSGPLWVTVDGKRLTYAGLRQIVRRRAQAAGVRVPSLHSFRRAFALLCLRQGMDVYSLQKLMGHADLSVLRRYLAQTEGDLKQAHERFGPVDKLLLLLAALWPATRLIGALRI